LAEISHLFADVAEYVAKFAYPAPIRFQNMADFSHWGKNGEMPLHTTIQIFLPNFFCRLNKP
jgi:hypothetical protein